MDAVVFFSDRPEEADAEKYYPCCCMVPAEICAVRRLFMENGFKNHLQSLGGLVKVHWQVR